MLRSLLCVTYRTQVYPKFHLLRHVTTCHACRDERVALVVRVVPCLFQYGGRRKCSARMYMFSILCSECASISGTTSGKKSEVDVSTPVHAVATPLNTCCVCRAVSRRATSMSHRAVRQARHSTSRLFPVPKCMG